MRPLLALGAVICGAMYDSAPVAAHATAATAAAVNQFVSKGSSLAPSQSEPEAAQAPRSAPLQQEHRASVFLSVGGGWSWGPQRGHQWNGELSLLRLREEFIVGAVFGVSGASATVGLEVASITDVGIVGFEGGYVFDWRADQTEHGGQIVGWWVLGLSGGQPPMALPLPLIPYLRTRLLSHERGFEIEGGVMLKIPLPVVAR